MLSAFKDKPRFLIAAIIVHALFIVLFAVSFHWTSLRPVGTPPTIKVRIVADKKPEEPSQPVVTPQPPRETEPPRDVELEKRQQQERIEAQRRQVEEQQRRETERKQQILVEKEKEKKRQKELEEKRKQEEIQREKKAFQDRIAAEQQRMDEEKKRRLAEQERQEAERKRQETEAIARAAEQKRQQTIIDKYVALIDQKVRQNWYKQPAFAKKTCIVKIKMLPTGEVINVTLVTSSGDRIFDSSVEHAITRASPLPLPPVEAGLFEVFRDLKFRFGAES